MLTFFGLLIWIALGYGTVTGALALNRVRRRRLGWLSQQELRTLEAHASRLQGPLARGLRAREGVGASADRRLRLLVDRSLRTLAEHELSRRQIRELLSRHTQRDLEDGSPTKRQEELESLRVREAELGARAQEIVDQLESLHIGLLAGSEGPEFRATLDDLELASRYWQARAELRTLPGPGSDTSSSRTTPD
jgi:hypothetical protein